MRPSTISNWIARGKLSGAALTADGRIVVAEANRQLGRNLNPIASSSRRKVEPPSTLAALRVRREKLAVERAEREAATERGQLIRANEAAAAWAQELAGLVQAIDLFVLDLPQKAGLDRDQAERVRREWRAFRERQAMQAEERARAGGRTRGMAAE